MNPGRILHHVKHHRKKGQYVILPQSVDPLVMEGHSSLGKPTTGNWPKEGSSDGKDTLPDPVGLVSGTPDRSSGTPW